jgi:DNA-binding NarL/FixJ family response regulator
LCRSIARSLNHIDNSCRNTLTSPHDLLAAVPFYGGPAIRQKDSLYIGGKSATRIKVLMAFDDRFSEPDLILTTENDCDASRKRAGEAIVVGYLPTNALETDSLATVRVIARHEIVVKECIAVRGNRFFSLQSLPRRRVLPPEGQPHPLLTDSRVTCTSAAGGGESLCPTLI